MKKRDHNHETEPVYDGRRVAALRSLATKLIAALEEIDGVSEGLVRYRGDAPSYRRVDCDRRTLATIRIRPRLRAVRVDINGSWDVPACRLETESSSATTLLVGSEIDLIEALEVLAKAIERGR